MKDVWLKATVVGSLWAAIEIVVGSFLHNLRVPLAGSILAFSSVILVVAFLRMWPVRGLAIRAALIAALMKSISPSAVIIGPMTGIFLEGVLIEFSILLLGLSKPAYILGGMLAVWSALLHKLVTLLLVYGGDMVTIIENLYQYAVRQIGALGGGLWEPIAVISLIYLITGATAAWIGMRLKADPDIRLDSPDKPSGQNLFEMTDHEHYSVAFLVVILAGLTGVLTLINLTSAMFYLPTAIFFLSFLAIRYQRAVRPLTRPKFWIQLVVITFLAALLIDGLETGDWLAWRGIQAGLLINLRAITVLMSFAAIGTELKNPLIKSLLYRRGFAQLYQSLQMAFSLLPSLMARMPARINRLSDIPGLASRFLGLSRDLFRIFAEMKDKQPHVFLVIGERQTGKTTFISDLVEAMQQANVSVGGFIARVLLDKKQVAGYRLRILDEETEQDFCMRTGDSGWDRIGRFFINPEGQEQGMHAFDRAKAHSPEIFVVDEVGPLEMGNRGWSRGIEQFCGPDSPIQIWSVRNSLARKVTRKWPGFQYRLIRLEDHPAVSDILKEIQKLLHQRVS